jgi:hypothetical protein
MLDKFIRPAGIVWVAVQIPGAGIVAQAAFVSPADAVEYARKQVKSLQWPVHFTVGSETIRADAFLTTDHAFEWVCDQSVYGYQTRAAA